MPVAAGGIAAGSLKLPGGKTATYSSYSVNVAPTAKTSYYVSVGTDESPHVTLAVRPTVDLRASDPAPAIGDTVAFSATVLPPSLAGTTVTLQTQTGGVWTSAGQATVGTDGTCTILWPATVAGTFSFRLQVPAAKGLSAATSATVTVTVGGSPGPSPSPSPSPSPPRRRGRHQAPGRARPSARSVCPSRRR